MIDRYRKYLLRRRMTSGDTLYRLSGSAHSGEDIPAPGAGMKQSSAPSSPRPTPGPGLAKVGRESIKGAVLFSAPTDPPIQRTESASGTIRISSSKEQVDLFGAAENGVTGNELEGLDLAALERMVSTCTKCPLCEGRTKSVFGSGDPRAKIVFVGEAPGKQEDLEGKPFVGRAGQLLTKILASVGFTRDEIYIANVLKCRPPDNRDPKEEEVRACKPYLRRQIELLQPVLICALGRVAAQNLLETNAALSVLRKNIHYYEDVKTIATYHPAALLRNPNLKRPAWEDIQEARRIYDEALNGI
jgi:DNA polymerase